MKKNGSRAPSSRPLKVGETVRHALSQIFQRGEVHDADLAKHNVTVTEVRMSPDLAHANVFVVPLGGIGAEEMMAALKKAAPRVRMVLAHAINLRYVPELHFIQDEAFENAARIHDLLEDPFIQQDLQTKDSSLTRDDGE